MQGWGVGLSKPQNQLLNSGSVCCVTLDLNLTFLGLSSLICRIEIDNFINYFNSIVFIIINQIIGPSWRLIDIMCWKIECCPNAWAKIFLWVNHCLGFLVPCLYPTMWLPENWQFYSLSCSRKNSGEILGYQGKWQHPRPQRLGEGFSHEEGVQFCLPWRQRYLGTLRPVGI